MTLRFIVIGLVVINVFLWGWAALQPEADVAQVPTAVEPVETLPDVPSIVLVRESGRLTPGGDQVTRQCFTLGPLNSRSVLQNVEAALSEAVINMNSHESTAVVEQGFWVYLEPFPSYSQAAEAVAQLVANGVRDYYIMPDGPFVNAVSVGLYEQRAQAEDRRQAIEEIGLGWPLALQMQRREESRFWVDYELRADARVAIEELLLEQDSVQQLQVSCPANEASFPPA